MTAITFTEVSDETQILWPYICANFISDGQDIIFVSSELISTVEKAEVKGPASHLLLLKI